MADRIFDNTIGALNTSLNLRLTQQNIISSNIANSDTPGYKTKHMDFETTFREALGTSENGRPAMTHPGHISPNLSEPLYPEIFEIPNDVFSLDENTVDRAEEMAKMAENQILYNASVDALRKKLSMLRAAIGSGGGGQ